MQPLPCERLDDFLARDLSGADLERFTAHLPTCCACQQAVREQEQLDTVLAEGDPDDIEWRRVTTAGTYLPDEQFVVVNRSQHGRAGQNVATPMRLDDGRVLIVNRGFVPYGVDIPPAPDGHVSIECRVRPSQRDSPSRKLSVKRMLPTARETAAVLRSIRARDRGPGIAVAR